MANKPMMGIENEFQFMRAGVSQSHAALDYFLQIVRGLPIPYHQKTERCVRLATGGSFYIDGTEPEVTTAPFYLEPGAVTGLAHNLVMNRDCVLNGLAKVNEQETKEKIISWRKLYLYGHSAHYNFTFPEIAIRTKEVASLLARTVNPAIQLFVENRKSSGVMYRYREGGRLEICGDFTPALDDVIAATAFQTVLLHTIDRWLADGAEMEDVQAKLRYVSTYAHSPAASREGYILKTPEVIERGRKGAVTVHCQKVSLFFRLITAQEILEHVYSLCEPAARVILTNDEQQLLLDSVEGKRKLPIDSTGYPKGYTKVEFAPVDATKAVSPLTRALGNAVEPRKVNGLELNAKYIGWDFVKYESSAGPQVYVSLNDLVAFDRLLEQHPELLTPLLARKLTQEQMHELQTLGLSEPYRLLEERADDGQHFLSIQPFFGLRGIRERDELIAQEYFSMYLEIIPKNNNILMSDDFIQPFEWNIKKIYSGEKIDTKPNGYNNITKDHYYSDLERMLEETPWKKNKKISVASMKTGPAENKLLEELYFSRSIKSKSIQEKLSRASRGDGCP